MSKSIRMRLSAALAAMFALAFSIAPSEAAQCAAPGRDGSPIGLTGVVNAYWSVTANASAGANSITLGSAAGASTPIAAGDLLLIVQMQDAQINSTNTSSYGDGVSGGVGSGTTDLTNSGLFEFVRATNSVSLAGGTVTIVGGTGGGLVNSYSNAAATGTRGQRRFQVIRVPQYVNATLGIALTAAPWDGLRGGILAIDVAGVLDLNGGSATVSGLGFRGGGGRSLAGISGLLNSDYRTNATQNANGAKGEGVAGTPRYVFNGSALVDTGVEGYPNGSQARGAPGNAGGGGTDGNPAANDQNTGGGGGGNRGGGGRGGHAWCGTAPSGCAQTGGFGGAAITSLAVGRLTLGGGGGAGTSNNATGSPGAGLASSGAAGGGAIFIRAGTIRGAGTFTANGANANNTVLNDGSGGGGAGGSVLIYAYQNDGASMTVSAQGGNGGSNTGGGSAHGPGGGGGGGFVATSFAVTASVGGGAAGTTVNGGSFGANYGATAGAAGASTTLVTGASVPGASSGGECTPVLTKAFSVIDVGINQVSRLTLTLLNRNPTLPLSSAAFTDTYPAAIRNAGTPAAATTCTGGSVTAAPNGGSVALSSGSISAASSCTVAVDTVGISAGDHTNTVAAGGLTGTIGGVSVASPAAASATLMVRPPLVATKASAVVSDPQNGTTNPKRIPGALVDYTITVVNPSARVVDANSVIVADAIPANTDLLVGDLAGAGLGPVAFTDGSPASTLTYQFVSLSSLTDGLEFSNNNGATFNYVPVPGPNGTDPAVTHIRVLPNGAHAASGQFQIRFRVRVE